MLCPRDTLVTVEGLMIHEGSQRSVIIEIKDTFESPTTTTIETVLGKSEALQHASSLIKTSDDEYNYPDTYCLN